MNRKERLIGDRLPIPSFRLHQNGQLYNFVTLLIEVSFVDRIKEQVLGTSV